MQSFGTNVEFARTIHQRGARFLVVGGLAVKAYVPSRIADDMDLLLDPSMSTAQVVHAALAEFGETPEFSPDKLALPKKQVSAKSRSLYVDLFTPLVADKFEDFYARGTDGNLSGVPVRIMGKNDLIAMKSRTANANLKDRNDIALLQAV